ncbi:hypothetical protein LRP67_09090 [Nocardioides sp. cx-169]|uniref:hypothetical protein n=1 Tax=Nocardioides sp. cx-169 TaxID=2899080 RepID=UPI001E3DC3B5|nr:hypothetical protein [Nocardioides sp. cx-169]MCD4534234.1 hypothetical protein [Nocardioides sp. cx-169]
MAVSPPLPGLPARPVLRPGIAIARHDDQHLRVGTDPPHRLVVADRAVVRRLLDALTEGRPLPDLDGAAWLVLRGLHDAGLLVDADVLHRLRPEDPALVAWTQFGASAAERLEARAVARVGVWAAPEVREPAARLLRDAGVGVREPGEEADVWLVASEGELSRGALDDLVRDGVPHLAMASSLGAVRLGPFVAPGTTACLRCVDAALAESDPRRALVVAQTTLDPGVPGPPRDPALTHLAVGWAVRDLLRYVEGECPSTWSTTYDLGPLAAPQPRRWPRHPHCGCAWDDLLTVAI